MAEPRETAVLDTEEPPPAIPPANADDRKAAAALSSLDAVHEEDESKQSRQRANIDQEALGRAISRLEIESGEKSGKGREVGSGGKGKEGADEGEKKKIKVDQADVALLVDELELSKGKATDMLRQYDGDAVKAMRAFLDVTVK